MRIDVFTLFPEMITAFAGDSLLGKAQERGLLDLHTHDPRHHTSDVHRTVDDAPFGGGAGMVLKPEPLIAAIEHSDAPRPVFLLGPGGDPFDQAMAKDLSETEGFSLICGRYEGVDQRVIDLHCDGEISIGDYVLAGGEVAAMVVLEAVGRLVPGVMGNLESADEESFSTGLLEYPHYTRPAVFRNASVPEVLRSGDHAKVGRWRLAQSLLRTARRRPDLLVARPLTGDDERVLAEFGLADEVRELLDGDAQVG